MPLHARKPDITQCRTPLAGLTQARLRSLIARSPGPGFYVPTQLPLGSLAASISEPVCPEEMPLPIRLPLSPRPPYLPPVPATRPPIPARVDSEPALKPLSRPPGPVPDCPIPLPETQPLPDRLRRFLWRHCAGLNPSPAASDRAPCLISRTSQPCRLARPATDPQYPACP